MATLIIVYFAGLTVLSRIDTVFPGIEPPITSTHNNVVPPPNIFSLPQATNSASLKVQGFAPQGTAVTLFVNEREIDSQITDKEGKFVFEDVRLDPGENKIYMIGRNQSGIESQPSLAQTVVVDQQPPKIELTSPEDGLIIKEEKDQPSFVTVSGSVSESAVVTVNGHQAIVNSENTFDHRLRLAEEGENIIKIEAQDKAGNKTTVEKTVIYKKLEGEEESES